MTDETKPVTAIVVGNSAIPQGTVATTPGETPNLNVIVLNPAVSVLVRAGRLFLQTMLGIMVAGGTGLAPDHLPPARDFFHLMQLSAGLAIGPAILCLIQNAVELLARLDQTNPAMRG